MTASGYLAAGLAASGCAGYYTVINNGGIRAVYNAGPLAGGGVVTNTGSHPRHLDHDGRRGGPRYGTAR